MSKSKVIQAQPEFGEVPLDGRKDFQYPSGSFKPKIINRTQRFVECNCGGKRNKWTKAATMREHCQKEHKDEIHELLDHICVCGHFTLQDTNYDQHVMACPKYAKQKGKQKTDEESVVCGGGGERAREDISDERRRPHFYNPPPGPVERVDFTESPRTGDAIIVAQAANSGSSFRRDWFIPDGSDAHRRRDMYTPQTQVGGNTLVATHCDHIVSVSAKNTLDIDGLVDAPRSSHSHLDTPSYARRTGASSAHRGSSCGSSPAHRHDVRCPQPRRPSPYPRTLLNAPGFPKRPHHRMQSAAPTAMSNYQLPAGYLGIPNAPQHAPSVSVPEAAKMPTTDPPSSAAISGLSRVAMQVDSIMRDPNDLVMQVVYQNLPNFGSLPRQQQLQEVYETFEVMRNHQRCQRLRNKVLTPGSSIDGPRVLGAGPTSSSAATASGSQSHLISSLSQPHAQLQEVGFQQQLPHLVRNASQDQTNPMARVMSVEPGVGASSMNPIVMQAPQTVLHSNPITSLDAPPPDRHLQAPQPTMLAQQQAQLAMLMLNRPVITPARPLSDSQAQASNNRNYMEQPPSPQMHFNQSQWLTSGMGMDMLPIEGAGEGAFGIDTFGPGEGASGPGEGAFGPGDGWN